MPTIRPRHQITETEQVARALDVAERQWPGESRAKLLVRLIAVGSRALEGSRKEQLRARLAVVQETSGAYDDAFDSNYLAELREDWPT